MGRSDKRLNLVFLILPVGGGKETILEQQGLYKRRCTCYSDFGASTLSDVRSERDFLLPILMGWFAQTLLRCKY